MEHDWQACTENAIAWARRYLGESSCTTRCLAFVEDAYERPNRLEIFGGGFARESAELYAARWIGGTPVQRIFEGCRPKDWTAEGDAPTAAVRMQAARFGNGAASD